MILKLIDPCDNGHVQKKNGSKLTRTHELANKWESEILYWNFIRYPRARNNSQFVTRHKEEVKKNTKRATNWKRIKIRWNHLVKRKKKRQTWTKDKCTHTKWQIAFERNATIFLNPNQKQKKKNREKRKSYPKNTVASL